MNPQLVDDLLKTRRRMAAQRVSLALALHWSVGGNQTRLRIRRCRDALRAAGWAKGASVSDTLDAIDRAIAAEREVADEDAI